MNRLAVFVVSVAFVLGHPLTLVLPAPCPEPAARAASQETIDFNRDIRPIFSNRCFRCHGPDESTVQAGLRLDTQERAFAVLDSGQRAIVPGKPAQSALIARVTADDAQRMPPPETGDPLTDREKQLLQQWIEAEAQYQRHWSFVPPTRPNPPSVSEPDWVRNPIDAFVMSRLDGDGLKPAPEATRYTLIRRVSLDLTGIPPRLDEVDRFAADPDPQAYENLVHRLLDSPAYGERWARVWLDLARYADSAGYAQDPPRTIWKYRDWVIRAINANMPFDQFTVEQIAGDMLPDPTEDQLIATAFHRNTMTNSEGGTDDEEFRNAAVVDRVNTTMQVWMGLTMGCAQCHDHKYDPITQEEYFQFLAVLNNTEDADRGDESPTLQTWTSEQKTRRAAITEEIASLEQSLTTEAKSPTADQLAELKKQLADMRGVTTPIMRELPPKKRRKAHIHIRGNFLAKGKEVSPGVPSAFHPLPEGVEPNRLSVAKWLVDRRNPFTARVVVNRYWGQLFGTGLVETSEDFGRQGSLPSHPQLLDYLATELMSSGWDTKALVHTIVTSATYRQCSALSPALPGARGHGPRAGVPSYSLAPETNPNNKGGGTRPRTMTSRPSTQTSQLTPDNKFLMHRVTPELRERDPANRLLARGPRFRLPAEMIRDQALSVSGLLSRKMCGPSVRPPRPVLGLRAAFGGSTDWETSEGEDRYRRGLYTSWRRTTPYPSIVTFDAPSREFCTVRRVRTNTPLQALVTLNDPVYVEAAQALARRMATEGGATRQQRAAYGFRLCLARPPSDEELARLDILFQQSLIRFQQSPDDARQLASDPLGPVPEGSDSAELAAWTVVGNVLLNLDEFLAKR